MSGRAMWLDRSDLTLDPPVSYISQGATNAPGDLRDGQNCIGLGLGGLGHGPRTLNPAAA